MILKLSHRTRVDAKQGLIQTVVQLLASSVASLTCSGAAPSSSRNRPSARWDDWSAAASSQRMRPRAVLVTSRTCANIQEARPQPGLWCVKQTHGLSRQSSAPGPGLRTEVRGQSFDRDVDNGSQWSLWLIVVCCASTSTTTRVAPLARARARNVSSHPGRCCVVQDPTCSLRATKPRMIMRHAPCATHGPDGYPVRSHTCSQRKPRIVPGMRKPQHPLNPRQA